MCRSRKARHRSRTRCSRPITEIEFASDLGKLDTILRRSTMLLTFVETLVFSARWHKRLNAENLRRFQNDLLEDPKGGDSIPGCGMLRKVRFGDPSRNKGKRGGVRVIYLYTPEANRIDLITVYGKDEADDLTKDEVRAMCVAAHMLRNEVKALMQRSGINPKGKP